MDPERIWLQPDCGQCGGERCWCQDELEACEDCGAKPVEYIRADAVALTPTQREAENLTNAARELSNQFDLAEARGGALMYWNHFTELKKILRRIASPPPPVDKLALTITDHLMKGVSDGSNFTGCGPVVASMFATRIAAAIRAAGVKILGETQ
jgi:hypothetical protein